MRYEFSNMICGNLPNSLQCRRIFTDDLWNSKGICGLQRFMESSMLLIFSEIQKKVQTMQISSDNFRKITEQLIKSIINS